MSAIRFLFASVAATLFAGAAFGQAPGTYRCLDANGRSTYTNVKEEMTGRKCTLVSREVSVVPAQSPPEPPRSPAAKGAAPPKPPVPKAAPVAARVPTDRRRILQEELGDEEKRLSQARQRLAEQQSVRSGDERNYQRVLDRLKPYLEAVENHEKNISQLKRELSQ